MDPLVSVVMPVYNSERYLNESINSILSQTYKNFEFIIVDDSSYDKSLEIIKSYDDPRIKLAINKRNLGISKTRNKGIAIAQGKYIAVFDSDDVAPSYRLSEQVDFLEQNPDYGLIGGYVQPIDVSGRKTSNIWEYTASPEKIPAILLFGNYFAQPAVMIRCSVLPKEGYNTDFVTAGDYDLWVRIARDTKVWNLPRIMVYYRINDKGITRRTKVNKSITSIKNILKDQLDYLNVNYNENELEIYLAMTNNVYDKTNEKLIKLLKDESFKFKYDSLLNKLLEANKVSKRYDPDSLKEVINEKKDQLLKTFVKAYYIRSNKYNLDNLVKFFKSDLSLYQHVKLKEALVFIIKCILRWRTIN